MTKLHAILGSGSSMDTLVRLSSCSVPPTVSIPGYIHVDITFVLFELTYILCMSAYPGEASILGTIPWKVQNAPSMGGLCEDWKEIAGINSCSSGHGCVHQFNSAGEFNYSFLSIRKYAISNFTQICE